MQQLDTRAIQDWFLGLFSWREKRSGMIAPDERLPWGETAVMGLQHVLAMFGATVLAPILMGFDPNVAIFFSGIGTILFFIITGGKIPSYLGSSFAFIAPVVAITGGVAGSSEIPKALGGIVICGVIYTLIGFIVHIFGSDWIDNLMPPIVTGGVVAIIGLNLADEARGMAQADIGLALLTILSILAIALLGKGIIGRLPILLGTAVGYLLAVILGGTSGQGREILGWNVSGVDFGPVNDAALFGMPNFQTPSFDGSAIGLIAPVAIVLVAENTGHIKAVSEMTRRNLMPFLGRGFIGDGVATTISGFGGGTGVTTYAENIGVMAVTRVFSTAIFIVASGVALILGFSPKFGALINSIPLGVLGGVSIVLFGLIAAAGIRIWIDNRVDFSKGINLFIAAVTLIVGASDLTWSLGNFDLNGIALGTFGSIILYQIFRRAPGALDEDPGATPASAGEPDLGDLDFVDEPRRRTSTGQRRAPQREPVRQRQPRIEEPRRRRPEPVEEEFFEDDWSDEPEFPEPRRRQAPPAERPTRAPQQRPAPQRQAPPQRRPDPRRDMPAATPPGRRAEEEPQMPPPPTIPPPPTRRQQRPAQAPERGYERPAGDDIVIDDPSSMPRGGASRPGRGGEYDFLSDDPRQRPPRRPAPQESWDEEDEFFDDEPLPPTPGNR